MTPEISNYQHMKKISVLFYLVTGTISFLFLTQTGHCQANFIGTWEGTFMNDFETVLNFNKNDENKFEGNIKMFAGNNLIQDDQINDISLINKDIGFYIPAKETSFEGSFNDMLTELSGVFIFPDGATHAIQLKRKIADITDVEEYRFLKEEKHDVQELHTDLQLLYTILKEQHPQLYTYSSKDSLDLLVEKILSDINEPLTLEEFYLQTAKLTHAVNCSHTGVKLPSSYQNLLNSLASYFPLRLFFTNGKAYYISGLPEGDHTLSPTNEVISINDRPVDEIIKQLFYFIPSEACNETSKYHELNKKFNTLFYLIDGSAQFDVRFKTGDSIKRMTVVSSNLSDMHLDDGTNHHNLVDFNYTNNKTIGLLKLPSFAIPEMEQYFNQLDSIFSDLETNNIQNLILDLRDNSGGHPIFAAQLLSYLTDSEFIYFKRNEDVKEFEPLYNAMQPNKLHFGGNVYVFVNGGCLSTAGHLISLLKFYTKAVFIGEEPGSTFRCNDFSMQMALPNSGIVLNVPRTTFETAVSGFKLCEPFPVDYKVNVNALDLINGADSYIDMVMSIYKR